MLKSTTNLMTRKTQKGRCAVQFLVTGYDGKDAGAPARRQEARDQHLIDAEKLFKSGVLLAAAAILNDDGGMVGSTLIMEFDSRADLQKWLDNEPYVTGKVWQEIQVVPCRVPGFIKS